MSEGIIPALCPDGFDVNIWEKVKDKELDSTFLLNLAEELKKQELSIVDVCQCLDMKDPSFIQEVSSSEKITCYDYHKVLGMWLHFAGNERELLGKLICSLCKLEEVQSESLYNVCTEFFMTQGIMWNSCHYH